MRAAARPRRELKFSGSGDAPSIQVSGSGGVMSNDSTSSGIFTPTTTTNLQQDDEDANLDIYHYLNPNLDKLEKQLIEKHSKTSAAEAAKEILRIASGDFPEGGNSPLTSGLNNSMTGGNTVASIAAQAMANNNSPSAAAARALAKAKEAAKRKPDPVLVQSSAISYEGGIDSATGLYDGQGKLVTIFGYEYNGNFKQGMMHGEGTIRWIKADITYSGTFDNNAITGRGKYEWPSGDSYHGDVLNGLRHNEGSMFVKTKSGKSSYTGKWENGKRHGVGMQIYPDQSKYTGEWKDDRRNGKGQMSYTGDAPGIFDGEWQNDVRHGLGKMKWDHAGGSYETYEGQWIRGYPHGKGVATFVRTDPASNRLLIAANHNNNNNNANTTKNINANSTITGGSFAGAMGTFGATRISPDGTIMNGFDNTPISNLAAATGQALAGATVAEHGLSQEATKSVNRYEGEFCAGKRHGFGSFVFDDGSQFEGFWRDNVKHGEGKFTTTNGVIFAATFDNGVPTRPLEEKALRPESLYVPTILPLYIVDILGPAEVASADTMSSIQALISRHFGLLRKVFLHYCNISKDTSIPFSSVNLNAPRAHGAMLLVQFLKFCSDSRLINRHVTVAAIGRMFLSFKDRDSTTQPNAFFAESPLLAAATAAAGVGEVTGNEKKKRRPNRLPPTSNNGGNNNNNNNNANAIKDNTGNQDSSFSEEVQNLIENGGDGNNNNNNGNNSTSANNNAGSANSGTRRRGASGTGNNSNTATTSSNKNSEGNINNNNNNNNNNTSVSPVGKSSKNSNNNNNAEAGQSNQQHLSDLVKGKLCHPWKRYAEKELHNWEQDPSPTLQFRDFVEAVIRVACMVYHEPFYGTTSQKLQLVIEEHIFRFSGGAQASNGLSQLNSSANNFFPLSRTVSAVLSSFKPQLRKIFDRFSEVNAFNHDVPRVSGVPAKEPVITLRQVAWIFKLMGLLRTEDDAKLAAKNTKKKALTPPGQNNNINDGFFGGESNNNNDDQPPGLPSWLNTGRFSISSTQQVQQAHARRASIARSDISTPPYFNSERIPVDNLSMSDIIKKIRQNPEFGKTLRSGGISLTILRHLWPYDSQIRFSRAMLKKYFLISMKPRSKKQEQKQQQQFAAGAAGGPNNASSTLNQDMNSTSLQRSFAGNATMTFNASAASFGGGGGITRGDGTLSATGFTHSLVSPASVAPSESPTLAASQFNAATSAMSSTSRNVSQAGFHQTQQQANQQQQQQSSRSGSPVGSAALVDDATYESLLRSKLRVLDAACGHDGFATNIDNTIALDIELTFVEFVELLCRVADCIYGGSELSEKLLQLMFNAVGPLCDVAHTVQI